MKEIDEVIEAHGGWPGAFQRAASTDAEAATSSVVKATAPVGSFGAEPEEPIAIAARHTARRDT
jgi:hypothetical protein